MASALRALAVLSLLVCLAVSPVAGRNLPDVESLQPQWFGHEGTILVPGFGRFIIPLKGTHHHPMHANPITGQPGGVQVPTYGVGTGRRNIPGGDDTFLPNPGVEVPIPGGTGGVISSPPST